MWSSKANTNLFLKEMKLNLSNNFPTNSPEPRDSESVYIMKGWWGKLVFYAKPETKAISQQSSQPCKQMLHAETHGKTYDTDDSTTDHDAFVTTS